jgi:hypothetical protein
VRQLPSSLAEILTLKHVLVEGCDLEVPKMAVAMKGMDAIRSYFRESGAYAN